MEYFDEELLSSFFVEANENIDEMENLVVELETDPENKDILNNIFRNMHSLKGSAGFLGFKKMESIAHQSEYALDMLRDGTIKIDKNLIDSIIFSIDTIKQILANLNDNGDEGDLDYQKAIDMVKQALPFEDSQEILEDTDNYHCDNEQEMPSEDVDYLVRPLSIVDHLKEIRIKDPHFIMKNCVDHLNETVDARKRHCYLDESIECMDETGMKDLYLACKNNIDYLKQSLKDCTQTDVIIGVCKELEDVSSKLEEESLSKQIDELTSLITMSIQRGLDLNDFLGLVKQEISILENLFEKHYGNIIPQNNTTQQYQEDNEQYKQEQEEEKSFKKPTKESSTQKTASANNQECQPEVKTPTTKQQQTVRVDYSKLDYLMNLIGELIITRNSFDLIAESLGKKNIQEEDFANTIIEGTNAMGRISDELQTTIMKVRMLSIKTVFQKFPRLVRDLQSKTDKKVNLHLSGTETELDKSIIESLGDPLVHLIRNSVDHGIESPQERKQKGKNSTGNLWISAYYQGNQAIIDIQDDGKGLYPDEIASKAVEKNILSLEDTQKMSDKEKVELIFAPGFSTAETVSDVSGRGVGMDVVRNNIRTLNGEVSISSIPEKGTTIQISLPLTLAIIEALMVTLSDQKYAIPLEAVLETNKVSSKDIYTVNGKKVMNLRDSVLGILDLRTIFQKSPRQDDHFSIVVLSVGETKVGLIVDDLLKRQEVVIKSLGKLIGKRPGLAGASIMGDGKIVLILDAPEICKMYLSTRKNDWLH